MSGNSAINVTFTMILMISKEEFRKSMRKHACYYARHVILPIEDTINEEFRPWIYKITLN